jgi:ATP-dependent HslUV protease ATP-binding subunit HslU
VTLEFTPDGLDAIAAVAAEVNGRTEDIGARRLQTVMERLLEEAAFAAPEQAGPLRVDAAYVHQRLDALAADADLSRYIL